MPIGAESLRPADRRRRAARSSSRSSTRARPTARPSRSRPAPGPARTPSPAPAWWSPTAPDPPRRTLSRPMPLRASATERAFSWPWSGQRPVVEMRVGCSWHEQPRTAAASRARGSSRCACPGGRWSAAASGRPAAGRASPAPPPAVDLGHRHRVVERHRRTGRQLVQHPVEHLDLRPVGGLGVGGLGMDGRDRRLQLVRADRPRGRVASTSRTPSRDRGGSHRVRSCSASGTSEPSQPVRAARRASVSSISASSPVTSPHDGRRPCSCRVSRIASSASDGVGQVRRRWWRCAPR